MPDKEFDLTKQPYVDVTIRFYLDFDPTEMRGVTCFKVGSIDVFDTRSEERLGSMAATTSGLPVLTDESDGRHDEFMCKGEEVWEAFQEALKKKRCPECGMLSGHKLQCGRRVAQALREPLAPVVV